MNDLAPPPSAEAQILGFAKARPAFTLAELAAHCTVSDWKRANALASLKRRKVIQKCGVHEGQDILTVHDPSTAMQQYLDPAGRTGFRSSALQDVISAATEVSEDKGTWKPTKEDEQRLWAYIASQCEFTKAQFLDQEVLPRHRLELVFKRWQRSGIIRYIGRKNSTSYFTAVSNEQRQAEKRDKRLSPHGRIWTAMRVAGTFTPVDLAANMAGIDHAPTVQTIKRYCEDLAQFGYLKTIEHSTRNKPARYRLIRNTGPLPPLAQRVPSLIDPNLDSITPLKGGSDG